MQNNFKVEIEKVTKRELAQRACGATIDSDSNISLDRLYQCMHSPIRTQIFYCSMYNIPSYVAMHLVRHVTIVPFVKSNRTDRRKPNENALTKEVQTIDDVLDCARNIPLRMDFIANAEALLNMSYKRLCYKASSDTVRVMQSIKNEVSLVDYDLAFRMVPHCIKYRNCEELKSCGFFKKFLDKHEYLCNKKSLLDVNSWFRTYNGE
jgi:hypothetical protein